MRASSRVPNWRSIFEARVEGEERLEVTLIETGRRQVKGERDDRFQKDTFEIDFGAEDRSDQSEGLQDGKLKI